MVCLLYVPLSLFFPCLLFDYFKLFFSSLLFIWILDYFALNSVVAPEIRTSILDLSTLILPISLLLHMPLLLNVLTLSILLSSKNIVLCTQCLLTSQYFVALYSFLHFQSSIRILLFVPVTFNISLNMQDC